MKTKTDPTPSIERALSVHAKSGSIRSYHRADVNRWVVITTTGAELRLTEREVLVLCSGLASAATRLAAFIEELRSLDVHVGLGRIDPECVTCRTAWPCTKAAGS